MKCVKFFSQDIHYSSTPFSLQFNHLLYNPDPNMKNTKTFCDASGFLMFFCEYRQGTLERVKIRNLFVKTSLY